MWKITIFFVQWNFTWTETYYAPGSLAFGALLAQAQTVCMARTALNGPQTRISAVRFVLLSQPRASQFMPTGLLPGPGTATTLPGIDPDQDSAPQFVALQVKFYGTPSGVCRRYLAGIPEQAFGTKLTSLNLSGQGGFLLSLPTFVAVLGAAGWSFRTLNQAAQALCQAVLTNAQFPGEIGVQFGSQIMANPGAGNPYKIYLKGFKKVNYRQFGLAGTYTVDPNSPGITASAAPYVYYLRNTSQVQTSNILQTGSGVQLAYTYPGFSSSSGPAGTGYSILSANHRKRGVSALALRGRSRSKP